ncbi:putative Vps51 Vps67 [Trypanosoma vivax]|uniref:Conserved oligomeric Golgi complex subunit 1 n=1 Tax=Trypanosoma vivax (strain Y486) TaxID=1055687 RepID=G0TRQ0_TRYVY|nr:putative Vps51 Vps67 [Trypanosoma vivax]CCC46621.1 conserved hypothetical protein [Trypanosoma vivax Y486]
MSSEEAIQEVQRIFMTNSVEQAHEYLRRITPGIKESDERLKCIVGQSYHEVMATCDQVVTLERTCGKLLQLQKQLQQKPLDSTASFIPLCMSVPHSFGRVGREAENEAKCPTKRANLPESPNAARTPPRSDSRCDMAFEGDVVGAGDCKESENGGPMCRQSERVQLIQDGAALEGLLGTYQLKNAAAFLGGTKKAHVVDLPQGAMVQQKPQLSNLHLGGSRMRHAIRELLRKHADNAAKSLLHSRFGGGRKLTQTGASRGSFSETSVGRNSISSFISYMEEAHAAVGIVTQMKPSNALLLLIETVNEIVKDDFNLISAAVSGTPFPECCPTDAGVQDAKKGGSLHPLRVTKWLRAAFSLPYYLQSDVRETENKNNIRGRSDSVDCGVSQRQCCVADAAVSLHVVLRAQCLFCHLVLYVASMIPRLWASTISNTDDHAAADSKDEFAAALPDSYEGLLFTQMSPHYQRQELQKLLTLRAHLSMSFGRRMKEETDVCEREMTSSLRMSGDFSKDGLRKSWNWTPTTEKAPGDVARNSFSSQKIQGHSSEYTSESLLRGGSPYLNEVLRHVCGLQILDPRSLRKRDASSYGSWKDKILTNRGVCIEEGSKPQAFGIEEVRRCLLGTQDLVLQLFSEVANAGLLLDPCYIGLQGQLSRQQGQALRERLQNPEWCASVTSLFDEAKWADVITMSTERALLRAVNAALVKADNICQGMIEKICNECREDFSGNNIREGNECENDSRGGLQKGEGLVHWDSVQLTLPQFARHVLRKSLYVSERVAEQQLGDKALFSLPPSFGVGGCAAALCRGAKEDTNQDPELAQAVLELLWPSSMSSKQRTSFNGMNRDAQNSNDNFFGARSTVPCAEVSDFLFTPEVGEADDALAHGCTAVCTQGGEEGGSPSQSTKRGSLHVILMRIFEAEQVWPESQATIRACIMEWFEKVLRRIQNAMHDKEEALKKMETEGNDDEERCASGTYFRLLVSTIVMFSRFSVLVEVLLYVLEQVDPLAFLISTLRDAIAACHRPWIRLLRSEWEKGLSRMYRIVLSLPLNPTETESASGAPLASTRGMHAMQYAACQLRAQSVSGSCEQQATIAYPTHVTPHLAELIFHLQYILYTAGANRHLHDTVISVLMSELRDGTASVIMNTVLPAFSVGIASSCKTMQSGMGAVLDFGSNRTAVAENWMPNDNSDIVLLHLYFDVLFASDVFSQHKDASSDSIAEALSAIEKLVDPVVWQLAFPLLKRASEQLLSASSLSFGLWNIRASGLWGQQNKPSAESEQGTVVKPQSGAVALPGERARFPLLPLIFPASISSSSSVPLYIQTT